MTVTVVLTCYKNDNPLHLSESIKSLTSELSTFNFEILVVVDGPIGVELQETLSEFKNYISVLFLEKNVGRAKARNIAIESVESELIAILDSDDININCRILTQCSFLNENKDIDVVSSIVEEFYDDNSPRKIKPCPETHELISKSLKFRCEISNPSIMFRKEVFEKYGGYKDYKYSSEDHELFVRWVRHGVIFYCIQKPLLLVRVSKEQRTRRGGFNPLIDDYRFRLEQIKHNDESTFLIVLYSLVYTVFRLSPSFIKSAIYSILRKKDNYHVRTLNGQK